MDDYLRREDKSKAYCKCLTQPRTVSVWVSGVCGRREYSVTAGMDSLTTSSQGRFCIALHLFHSCDPDPKSKGKKQYGQHVFNDLQLQS